MLTNYPHNFNRLYLKMIIFYPKLICGIYYPLVLGQFHNLLGLKNEKNSAILITLKLAKILQLFF